MDLIYFIFIAYSVIMAIAFFFLCSNVSKIAAKLEGNPPTEDFKKYIFYGDTERAKEIYKNLFWKEYCMLNIYNTPEKIQADYEELILKYPRLAKFGIVVPTDYKSI